MVDRGDLVRAVGGVGAAVDAGGAAADGGPDPPPLGMDADPSMFRRPRKEGERGANDGGRDEGRSKGRRGKFDDPASTTAFVKGLFDWYGAVLTGTGNALLPSEKRISDADPFDVIWFDDSRKTLVQAFLKSCVFQPIVDGISG